MGNISFTNSEYLGGLSSDRRRHVGNLYFTDEAVGVGLRKASKPPIPVGEIVAITIDSEVTSKSHAGRALMFGVLAGGKSSQTDAIVTITVRNGETAIFKVGKMSPSRVQAKLSPWIAAHVAPAASPAAAPAADASVDQLQGLAALHASGALTDEEFTAAKARLLS